MIVPNKLLSADYATATRAYLCDNARLTVLRDYSGVKVFPVNVYPVVYAVQKIPTTAADMVGYQRMREANGIIEVAATDSWNVTAVRTAPNWGVLTQAGQQSLVAKIASAGKPLATVATCNGAATVAEAYVLRPLIRKQGAGHKASLRVVNTGTIDRYCPLWGRSPMRYLGASFLKPIITAADLATVSAKRLREARSPKIIAGGMIKELECILDTGQYLAGKSTSIILDASVPLPYLLSLLNSKLMTFFYRRRFAGLSLQGGFFRVGPPQLRALPIPTPKNLPEVASRLATYADVLTAMKAKLMESQSDHERNLTRRKAIDLEARIDAEVYQLFGLTAAEIADVEKAME